MHTVELQPLGVDRMIKQEPANWYAVQTRARNEKAISERLQEQGLTTFLRLVHRNTPLE